MRRLCGGTRAVARGRACRGSERQLVHRLEVHEAERRARRRVGGRGEGERPTQHEVVDATGGGRAQIRGVDQRRRGDAHQDGAVARVGGLRRHAETDDAAAVGALAVVGELDGGAGRQAADRQGAAGHLRGRHLVDVHRRLGGPVTHRHEEHAAVGVEPEELVGKRRVHELERRWAHPPDAAGLERGEGLRNRRPTPRDG